MVLRPDSGDPIEAVLAALDAAEKVFGVDTNKKGYKVPCGCGVIQGDGINLRMLSKILTAVMEKGFSAEVSTFLVASPGRFIDCIGKWHAGNLSIVVE